MATLAEMRKLGIDPSRRNARAIPLSDSERKLLEPYLDNIHYSQRFVCARAPTTVFVFLSLFLSFYCLSMPNALADSLSLPTLRYRYSDDEYEYRHVLLPKQMLKLIPDQYLDESKKTMKLLWEDEWRSMGITQVRHRPPAYVIVCSHLCMRSLLTLLSLFPHYRV